MMLIAIILVGSLMVPAISEASEGSVVDVIVVDGQSNAEDWGSFANEINTLYTEKPSESLYYYGTPTATTHFSDSSSVAATYGVQPMYSDDKWVIGGYAAPLCNGYADKNGHDVFYINIGCSGQSISALQPTGTRGAWGFGIIDDALDKIKDRYDTVNMIGWIWAQGEADKTMSVDTYISDFDKIQTKFESYGLDECYIIHTREEYGGNATTAQAQIAESDPNVTMTCMFTESFTVEDGDLRSDGEIHYSQQGRIKIANELVEVIPTQDANHDNTIYYAIPVVAIVLILIGAIRMMFRDRD